ncbi:MAG: adenosylmethionine--8-amino-7-oxononanoate transaminase [Thermoleophilia bacterium]|nr:adenosylmethionine--8-amino-7-oxononanoate transaminase [Thermoleophilia bacterium]
MPEPGPSQISLELDRRHVWHPYGPMPAARPVLPVESAEGVRLKLSDGRELVDGMSSWWSAIHGYRHPALDAAAKGQIEQMSHVMFGGLTHAPAIQLAERLIEMTPEPLQHVFFADSGSVAVEVAIKMCLQARPGRTRMLTVRGGYHGDTFGAMALCDPVAGMHSLFAGALTEHVFAPRPPRELDDDYVREIKALATAHADELAAVVVEPVVQGAGGMWFYDPALLRVLREICDRHDLLLVFDEIATGFGRTGELFACEHAGVSPDVMCVGKALSGGYLTLAATLCTSEVASSIEGGALMHGPTYMANPLACSVALASTGLLLDGSWRDDVSRIESNLKAGLEPARELEGVNDVRVLGAIGVIQLEHPVDMEAATEAAVSRGVWLRPFRDLIYTMPPYVTGDEDLDQITAAMIAAASEPA